MTDIERSSLTHELPHSTRIPGEWEAQYAIQLTWPHAQSDWLDWLDDVDSVYRQLVEAIALYQNVIIACHPECFDQVKTSYQNQQNVNVYCIASNDTWARDHGPISQYKDGKLRLLNFQFNGWGSKYGASLDNQITPELTDQDAFGAIAVIDQDWILEGGSIESDGLGSCLTTTRCLLNPNRNPDFNKTDIEQNLVKLGFNRVLWLSEGYLIGDDTDAHIDTLARFCDSQTIAYVRCTDKNDEQFQPLLGMENQLKQLTRTNGQPYRLVPLPLPSPCYNQDGDRLPATYANFLIINQAVLLPVYGVDEDGDAIKILADIFPDRCIIPINCRTIIEQYGSLHCLTMQIHQQFDVR